ncbi:MAG: type II toxin-antitoxin system HicB family antitoxin [Methanosarcinales archaeon]
MNKLNKYRFQIIIEQDEDGIYIVDCPVLKGCHSYGETLEEAIENIKEAIQCNLEYELSKGKKLPQFEILEVAIA